MLNTEAIRARLVQRRRSLLTRYRDELERVEEELAARDIEFAERAAEEWDARVLSSLGDADIRSIARVNDALARLDGGGYGTCVGCEGSIAEARLAAIPEATTCVRCAAAAEH